MQDTSINNLPETMRALVLQEHGTLDQVQMATIPLCVQAAALPALSPAIASWLIRL
jgi:hypothetical protein